jgi:hypothetical protein
MAALVVPSLLLPACASKPVPVPERVQMVSAVQKESDCKSLGTFSVSQKSGPDKPTAVLVKAMNEVTKRGGNGLYVVSNSVDWEDGAAMEAEALQCLF